MAPCFGEYLTELDDLNFVHFDVRSHSETSDYGKALLDELQGMDDFGTTGLDRNVDHQTERCLRERMG